MKCEKCCGELHRESIEKHEADSSLYGGIRVVLVNGSVQGLVCKNCKHVVRVEIPDAEGLTAAVVVARALMPVKLNGREIKFMRKAMELPAKELAEKLDVSEETISRWENQQVIGGANEKLFRYLACNSLGSSAPAIPWEMDHILDLNIGARLKGEEILLFYERANLKVKATIKPVWTEEPRKVA